jgi:hypothetical protein
MELFGWTALMLGWITLWLLVIFVVKGLRPFKWAGILEHIMDVTFSIAICASLVTIADRACSEKNALKVLQKPIHVVEVAEVQNACTREAYEYLRSFPRPNGDPITVSWNCSSPEDRSGTADGTRATTVASQR